MNAAILNTGEAAWVFEEHAQKLARAFGLEIVNTPAQCNYLLGWDEPLAPPGRSFIPFESIQLASDKRLLAAIFEKEGVATPRTYLIESSDDVQKVLEKERNSQWVLKWPTGCGATGHRLIEQGQPIPLDWPKPFVLQEFIQLEVPEVYRLYAVAGETFGWNARRFPAGGKTSPFVAHAQGARYEVEDNVPPAAEEQARRALEATNLLGSFGCADLMKDRHGNWLVLEVNTDGIHNHVDRDIDIGNLAAEIDQRLATAFHAWVASASKP
jgi:glutathione synthase/RimK-type ligase-like ATP-grasp enzyme